MTDTFEDDFHEAKTKLDKLKNSLDVLRTAKENGQNIKSKAYMVSATQKTLSINMDNLQAVHYTYTDQASKINISQKLREERIDRIDRLKNEYEKTNAIVTDLTTIHDSGFDDENPKQKPQRGADGEYDDTRG